MLHSTEICLTINISQVFTDLYAKMTCQAKEENSKDI